MIDRKMIPVMLAALFLAVAIACVVQSSGSDVDADGVPATGISLDRTSVTIRAGQDVTLHATLSPSDCTDTVTWSSKNSLIAAVDQNGSLTPKAYGSTTVTASARGYSATCSVSVEYSDLAISSTSLSITEGKTGSLSVTLPDGCTSVVWRSSNSNVATVSGNTASTTVTAVGVGNATITAICGNLYKATCAVTVKEKPVTIDTYYFHISMDMDANLADVGTSGLTVEDLQAGFTLTAQGANAGAALESALRAEGIPCSFWSGSSGAQDLLYWVDSIMGLGDVHLSNGDWKYWVQYHYAGGKYVYNDLTLGHYTGGGTFKVVYSVTSDPSSSGTASLPSAASGLVYNGQTQTGVASGTGYTITGNTAKNAGSYTATLTLQNGYKWADGSTGKKTVSWSISKAVLTARYVGETITEGSTPSYAVSVTGFVNGETASAAAGYKAPKVTNSDVSVGSHTLTPSGGSATNYSFRYQSGVLKVTSLNTVQVPSADSLVYNGKVQTGVPSGTGYTISGNMSKNAGSHMATLTLKSGYKWADGSTGKKTVSWSISKAVLTARYVGETITEGSTPSYAVSVTGFVNGETASTAAGYKAPEVSCPDLSAGSYMLTPSGGSATNYTFQYMSGVLTVIETSTISVGDSFMDGAFSYKVTSLGPLTASLTGYSGSQANVSIPESASYAGMEFQVISIGDKAFYGCTTLKSLDLGSVEDVGFKAFANCSKLVTLAVPETVKLIEGYAFYGCGIKALDIPGDDVVLEASAFSACKNMTDITFSGHGAVIGANAFYKNNGVSSVDLSTVASVGTKAFPYCNGMTSLVIPGNLESVGAYAFYQCANLRTLVVEEGVKTLSRSAFSGCKAIESASFPSTLASVGQNAFYGLKFADADGKAISATAANLRGNTFSKSGSFLVAGGGLQDGDEFAVERIQYVVTSVSACTVSITGYTGAVTSIPAEVAYDDRVFTVESIGDKAFLRCTTLESADLSNVKTLGSKALGNCTGMTHIVFGDSLRGIGDYALYGLSFYDGAKKLTISPSALKGHAFSGSGADLYMDY
ncbi:MAG: leucine-rich repeat protein [Candidatus Methanomethylophilaceae archaeon]|nr:leucine-rich repeat protein [Candidatus Methanomethylophilaceae archaeon]